MDRKTFRIVIAIFSIAGLLSLVIDFFMKNNFHFVAIIFLGIIAGTYHHYWSSKEYPLYQKKILFGLIVIIGIYALAIVLWRILFVLCGN